MSEFSSISPNDLAILSTIVAIALAKDRSNDDINVLGNFLTTVASILLTIAAQQQSLQDTQNTVQQIKDLKKQIKDLEKGL